MGSVRCRRHLSLWLHTFRAQWPKLVDRTAYIALLITYSLLSSVSLNIFKARQCESFVYDVREGRKVQRSYLIADSDIECSDTDAVYKSLQSIFWVFFAMWTLLVPAVYALMLYGVGDAVRSGRTTSGLAAATSFLWKGES